MQTHTHTHIAEEVLHIHLNAQICVKHAHIHMHLYKFNGGYVKYAGNCLQIISIGIGIWQQRRNKFLLHTRKQQYRKSRYSLLRYIYIYTHIYLYIVGMENFLSFVAVSMLLCCLLLLLFFRMHTICAIFFHSNLRLYILFVCVRVFCFLFQQNKNSALLN